MHFPFVYFIAVGKKTSTSCAQSTLVADIPIGSEKLFGYVPPVGVEGSTSCLNSEQTIH